MIPFEKDEWEAWREHPIAVWLFDHFLVESAKEAKDEFINYAWNGPGLNPAIHAAFFERNKVLLELKSLTYDDLEAGDKQAKQ